MGLKATRGNSFVDILRTEKPRGKTFWKNVTENVSQDFVPLQPSCATIYFDAPIRPSFSPFDF